MLLYYHDYCHPVVFLASSRYIDYDNEAESDTTNVHLYLVDPDAEDTLSEG